jgi:hypothetical protein
MLKVQAVDLPPWLQGRIRRQVRRADPRSVRRIMKVREFIRAATRADVAPDRERLKRVPDSEKLIPVIEIGGREASARLVSRDEVDRLAARGEVLRQSGLVVRRTR